MFWECPFYSEEKTAWKFYLQPVRVCSVEWTAESEHKYDFAFMLKAIQASNVTLSDDEPAQQMTLRYA